MPTISDPIWTLMSNLSQSHPWHGIPMRDGDSSWINCFIEIVPTDTVKYEVDKKTGHLKVDRPQKYSNVTPSLYGFIPQTLCGAQVARYSAERSGLDGIEGDGDPLDICVLTEKSIAHGGFIAEVVPIGGFRMIDGNEADDKIIAVLKDDASYGSWQDIRDCQQGMLSQLRHYFYTYKLTPGHYGSGCEIVDTYGRDEAWDVIKASRCDYELAYPGLSDLLDDVDHRQTQYL